MTNQCALMVTRQYGLSSASDSKQSPFSIAAAVKSAAPACSPPAAVSGRKKGSLVQPAAWAWHNGCAGAERRCGCDFRRNTHCLGVQRLSRVPHGATAFQVRRARSGTGAVLGRLLDLQDPQAVRHGPGEIGAVPAIGMAWFCRSQGRSRAARTAIFEAVLPAILRPPPGSNRA